MQKKYTVICVAGLTEDPHTFAKLKKRLERQGHKVLLAKVTDIKSFTERKKRCENLVQAVHNNNIILVGVSAGGGAVCSVAQRYKSKVQGVVLLSPALPRTIKTFWTKDLFKLFLAIAPKVLLGGKITLTEKQYLSVANPIPEDSIKGCLATRLPIFGKEVRQLLVPGIPFPRITCPVFHAYGTEDRMLHPRAHKTFQRKLSKRLKNVTVTHINSGHFLLASSESDVLIEKICTWISNL